MNNDSLNKILIITLRADIGGGPEHVYNLVNYLQNDFSFYIAAPDDWPYYDKYVQLVGQERYILLPHRKFSIKHLIKLRRFVVRNGIQIIHSHGKGAGVYSRLLNLSNNIKVIHTFHGFHIGQYNFFNREVYIYLEKLLGIFTARFINVSRSENELITKYRIAKQSKLEIIENGVKIPEEGVSPKNLEKHPLKVISFSRFDYPKNSSLIISIVMHLRNLKKLENFKFYIFGVGPEQKDIQKLCANNDLIEYIFLPGATTNNKQELLNSFCYISTSRWEGLPLGVLEAFAYGLPVIASNVVGNYDLIDNKINGFLFELNKPEIAAENILQLASDRELWLKLSQNARSKAEKNYNIKQMVSKTKQLYLNILN